MDITFHDGESDTTKCGGFMKILFTCFLAWLVAQVTKVLLSIVNKEYTKDRLTGTGGMPSSHSATVIALLTSVGIHEGIHSTCFVITTIFAFIVIYDALNLRYQCGLHAKAINEINYQLNIKNELNEKLGHTFNEVLVGSIVGFIVAMIVH